MKVTATADKDFDKTLNQKNRKGKYKVVELDLGSGSKPVTPIITTKANEEIPKFEDSYLDKKVQNLMEFITDNKAMEKTLTDVGYDIKKCPLEKLSADALKAGYVVLSDI
jgi:poly [ADP-ribose] polymerase